MTFLTQLETEVRFVHAVTAGGSEIFTCSVNFARNNAIYNMNESIKNILSEVEFVHPVSAGGSVKFLPAV